MTSAHPARCAASRSRSRGVRRQRPRRPRRPRGRGPRRDRRERRGQEHAGQDPLRLLPGRRRRDPPRRHARRRSARPRTRARLGIGMVFQELVQVPALTVAENIALFLPGPARPSSAARRWRRASRRPRERYGLDVDPAAPVWRLSVGERQKVEIVKLLLARRPGPRPRRADPRPRAARGRGPARDLRRPPARRLRRRLHHPQAGRGAGGADRITVMRRGRVVGLAARGRRPPRRRSCR